MPLVWLEPHGIELVLMGTSDARAMSRDGKPLTFPSSAQQFLISMAGRHFGVYLPPNAKIAREADSLRMTSSGKSFAAIAALSKPDDFKLAAGDAEDVIAEPV